VAALEEDIRTQTAMQSRNAKMTDTVPA